MNQLYKMHKVYSGYMLFSYIVLLYNHLMNNCSHDLLKSTYPLLECISTLEDPEQQASPGPWIP